MSLDNLVVDSGNLALYLTFDTLRTQRGRSLLILRVGIKRASQPASQIQRRGYMINRKQVLSGIAEGKYGSDKWRV